MSGMFESASMNANGRGYEGEDTVIMVIYRLRCGEHGKKLRATRW